MTALIHRLRRRARRRLHHAGTETASARPTVTTRAERAECTCPDTCERDHELD